MQMKTRKKRQGRWVEEMVFNNFTEAEETVTKEGHWSYYYTNITVDGKKKFCGCNKIKLRGKECNACIYLLFKCTSDEIVLFRDKSDRTHDNIQRKSSKISNEVKEGIKELFQLKL